MTINDLCGRNVLCKQGEYGIEVSFDYTEWLNEFGSGSVGWAFQRSRDTSAYLLPDVEADGVSTVTLTETESQYSGQARLEVFFVNDGQTEKRISRTFDFFIQPSLQNLGDVPTEWQSYIDAVHQYATDAEEAKEAIEAMTATASVDAYVGTPSVVVTKTDDPFNLDFAFHNLKGEQGIQGEKGDKGDTGNVMYATFAIVDGELQMYTDAGYSGANFSINNGYLEVAI